MEGQEPNRRCVIMMFAVLLAMLSLQQTGCAQDEAAASKLVTGVVIDEAGKPIAGAVVTAVTGRGFTNTSALLKQAPHVSDGDGAFSVPVTKEHQWGRVIVVAKGRQSLSLQVTQEHVKHGGDLGQVLLPKGAQLIGRVRDEQGAPMAGVTIDVASAIQGRMGYRAMIQAGGESNAKGIFSVAGVPRTGLRLTASMLGYATVQKIVAQGSAIDLTMERTGLVQGKVVDRDGKAIAGAMVSVQSPATLPAAPRSVFSASDGTFSVTAPPAGLRYRISAHEREGKYRAFSSGLLRGTPKDVVVTSWQDADHGMRDLAVEVRDAKTKKLVDKFTLQSVWSEPSNLQIVMFHARKGEPHEGGRGTLKLAGENTKGVLVRAPGYAFEAVAVPGEADDVLVVELQPEAVLTGVVTDERTGKPMAGVHVRALPTGRSSGSGGSLEGVWPVSDAQGRYRIGGLRSGEYGVQAHGFDRVASKPKIVKFAVNAEAECNLKVPPRKEVHLKILGEVPPGPARVLHPGLNFGGTSMRGGFEHRIAPPVPAVLVEASTIKFGPLTSDEFSPTVYVPSRTRAGTGTHVALDTMKVRDGEMELPLPDLSSTLVRGRIEPNQAIPFERVAVMAMPMARGRQARHSMLPEPCLAGVGADGAFAIDLPAGSYVLQLVDVLTGIVFYTKSDDYTPDDKPLVMKPSVHWLQVVCRPEQDAGPVIVQSIAIKLSRPGGGRGRAFLNSGSRSNNVESSATSMPFGTVRQRWLVPEGDITLALQESYHALRPWQDGWEEESSEEVSVHITKAEHELVLTVSKPPTDEEVLKR